MADSAMHHDKNDPILHNHIATLMIDHPNCGIDDEATNEPILTVNVIAFEQPGKLK
jgi:hypothetical protein